MNKKMIFNNEAMSAIPQVHVRLELTRDSHDLDIMFDEVLIGFFSDGKLWLCNFPEKNASKIRLEAKGVLFEKPGDSTTYCIATNLQ